MISSNTTTGLLYTDSLTMDLQRPVTTWGWDFKGHLQWKIDHDFYISLYLFTHAMDKKHILNC